MAQLLAAVVQAQLLDEVQRLEVAALLDEVQQPEVVAAVRAESKRLKPVPKPTHR